MYPNDPFKQPGETTKPKATKRDYTLADPKRRILRVVMKKDGKAVSPEEAMLAKEQEAVSLVDDSLPKRRRGRPPKPKGEPGSEVPAPAKRRGRPPRKPGPPETVIPTPVPVQPEVPAQKTGTTSELVPVKDIFPSVLPILPVTVRPLMPGLTVPLTFQGEVFAAILAEVAESADRMLGVSMVKVLDEENVLRSELQPVGTVLKLVRLKVTEDGIQVLARALQRIECVQVTERQPVLRWQVAYHPDPVEAPSEEIKAYTLSIISEVKELLNLSPLFQEQLKMLVSHFDFGNPGLTMDLITALTTADAARVQDILATFDLVERGKKVLQLLKEELTLQKLQQQIKGQIDEKIAAHQKEFFLREQLRVIKKELGIEKDEKSADLESFRQKLEKLPLTAEARKVAEEELAKLTLLEPASQEYPMIRGYLSWIVDLPWGKTTADNLDLMNAKTVLDSSHFGLDDVKDRILEFVATVRKRGSLMGTILCLVGPPGVGKTSIGRSIADTLGRKFYRFSVGGMRDEAEIKGHRRTYIGAMPGKIIQALKRADSSNPVILIDEIDKLQTSYQGDPAAALLEVLDPEQNKDFLDHYLDLRFDLSKVLFITTANSLDTIPSPLLDRMEVIKLSGYVLEEKLEIAKRYLIPTQLKEHGLEAKDLKIADKILGQLIDQYAREAGVRTLENQIKKLCRKVARWQVEGKGKGVALDAALMLEFLGLPLFSGEELYNNGVPGVALGLAWTAMGGATLYMEAKALMNQGGGFKTTGRLGETMGESAQIAYSVARNILTHSDPKAFDFFSRHLVHLHVPEGATPKDGPSAGITMALALHSLATGKPVQAKLAMTGELTLTGKVLPIGGVREKVIAAKRLKVSELILPKANERDFVKLPDYIKDGVTVHYADWFGDVLQAAYAGKAPTTIAKEFLDCMAKCDDAQTKSATTSTPVALAPVSTDKLGVVTSVSEGKANVATSSKRRGRPPRSPVATQATESASVEPAKRKRGRPAKPVDPSISKEPKKRGRPPKKR